MTAEIFNLKNFMKIVVYLILVLMVLISAFVIIFASILTGARFSVLGSLAIYGTWQAEILTASGYALAALLFAIPSYCIFTHARIRATWLCFVLVTPIISFWLYIALNKATLDQGSRIVRAGASMERNFSACDEKK